jgi:hypothetical protein
MIYYIELAYLRQYVSLYYITLNLYIYHQPHVQASYEWCSGTAYYYTQPNVERPTCYCLARTAGSYLT